MSGQVWSKPEGPQRGLSRTQLPYSLQTGGRTSTFLSCQPHPLLSTVPPPPQLSPKRSSVTKPCPRSEPEPPPPGGNQGCSPGPDTPNLQVLSPPRRQPANPPQAPFLTGQRRQGAELRAKESCLGRAVGGNCLGSEP